MKFFVFLVFVLLGIGRNLPFQELYFYGLGVADFLLFFLFLFFLLIPKSCHALLYEFRVLSIPIVATYGISALAMTSLAFNASIFGIDGKDIFEIFKYFYLLIVMVVTSYCTRWMGIIPALGFVLGAIVTGVIAMLNPMNPNVYGTLQIFNPNVIGNVLSVAIIFCSFIVLAGYPLRGGLLAIFAAILAFFTFSKASWLMSIFGLIACYLALTNLKNSNSNLALKYGKYLTYLTFVGLLYTVYAYWDVISLIVNAKIVATDFEASAVEGGSFSARVGLMLSAFHMFLINPVLGVGISNFEHVNYLLQGDLGDAYYNDDNANSAWFYILGCMGLPAFILFTYVFYWFLRRVYRFPFSSSKIRHLYVMCVAVVFLIGGNVQLEMLTAYYYWVALGLVVAWKTLPAGMCVYSDKSGKEVSTTSKMPPPSGASIELNAKRHST